MATPPYSVFFLLLCLSPSQSLSLGGLKHRAIRSIPTLERIKTASFRTSDATADATIVPLDAIGWSSDDDDSRIRDGGPTLFYASDFVPRQDVSPPSEYGKNTRTRHSVCVELFDGYSTEALRCEALDETSINLRWKASWIPAGSLWLYGLADFFGWEVEKKSPDPAKISTFSARRVAKVFADAFRTGTIILPVSLVEGNTVISIDEHSDTHELERISLKESIDLILEADAGRLQNRRVAQELASWLDVSRRPDECGIEADEWAGMVRSRILSGVPGTGSLDVDPNEDDSEGAAALLIFGVVLFGALALSFPLLVGEVVGGTGTVSAQCDDAAIVEFGSAYLSECFGPYGDGPSL